MFSPVCWDPVVWGRCGSSDGASCILFSAAVSSTPPLHPSLLQREALSLPAGRLHPQYISEIQRQDWGAQLLRAKSTFRINWALSHFQAQGCNSAAPQNSHEIDHSVETIPEWQLSGHCNHIFCCTEQLMTRTFYDKKNNDRQSERVCIYFWLCKLFWLSCQQTIFYCLHIQQTSHNNIPIERCFKFTWYM